MTHPIDLLTASDMAAPKKLAVIGDSIIDVWLGGRLVSSVDGCPAFDVMGGRTTPGGAAGAARALARWCSTAHLISPWRSPWRPPWGPERGDAWAEVNDQLCLELGVTCMPTRERMVDESGKIVWRTNLHDASTYGLDNSGRQEARELALLALRQGGFHGVLVCDYLKGFLDRQTIREIIDFCKAYEIPCVVDGKRAPEAYTGAVLKCNQDYYINKTTMVHDVAVVTRGRIGPLLHHTEDNWHSLPDGHPVVCRNHVGAGDCFAAHLLLGLVHGLSLVDAAGVAHSAGRAFVQHALPTPPWPFEVARDCTGHQGKVVLPVDLAGLRRMHAGKRLVFTNGVFRLLTAAHVRMLAWAKEQGDVLVVAVNDATSAFRCRPGEFVLPEVDRLHLVGSQESVDWVVPMSEDDPRVIIEALAPDVLVKGGDYLGQRVPGDDLVKDVRFAPVFEGHVGELTEAIRR
jgi:rfaE bifunctional protein nucleotidyltransferase chain/domain